MDLIRFHHFFFFFISQELTLPHYASIGIQARALESCRLASRGRILTQIENRELIQRTLFNTRTADPSGLWTSAPRLLRVAFGFKVCFYFFTRASFLPLFHLTSLPPLSPQFTLFSPFPFSAPGYSSVFVIFRLFYFICFILATATYSTQVFFSSYFGIETQKQTGVPLCDRSLPRCFAGTAQ